MTTSTINYAEFVSEAMRMNAKSGNRWGTKGNQTFVALAEAFKVKFGLPLNSRLSDEDANGIRQGLRDLMDGAVANMLEDYDKFAIKQSALYCTVNKEGAISKGARASITARRDCRDKQEELLATRLARGNVVRSMDNLNKRLGSFNDRDEARMRELEYKLTVLDKEIARLTA